MRLISKLTQNEPFVQIFSRRENKKYMELNKFYIADSVEFMKNNIPDNFVDLTITSPPYDDLRTYKGYKFDFYSTAKELFRITKDGGIVVWIVGDKTKNGSESGTSFSQALYFKEIGFNLHDTMIYAKTNPIPQNHNRYEQAYEFMFVLSKCRPKCFNPIKEPTKNPGKDMDWGNRKTIMDKTQCRWHREKSDIVTVGETKNHTNIFYYSIGGGKTGHPAVFPEQLAQDHILTWSNEGDVVFDPMCGSGTTCKMAKLNNRNYIGIDVSEEYINEICIPRLAQLEAS